MGALRDEAILSLENISGSLFNRNRKNADRDEAVQRTFRPAQDAGKLGDHEQVVRRGAIVRLTEHERSDACLRQWQISKRLGDSQRPDPSLPPSPKRYVHGMEADRRQGD